MAEKYRPSSGTEGDGFFATWCMKCARDKSMSEGKDYDLCAPEEICPIIDNTFAYEVDDPKYPVEWIHDETGPKCTAFIPAEQGMTPERCALTIDMFDGS